MNLLHRICPPMGLLTALAAAGLISINMPAAELTPLAGMSAPDAKSIVQAAVAQQAGERGRAGSALDPEIWDRPLFAEGRRPPARAAVEPAVPPEPEPVAVQPVPDPVPMVAAPPPLPDIRMLGAMSNNGVTQALVALAGSDTQIWVESGHSFDGWILTKISQSDIQLSYETTEVTIQLFE